jgi:hypothetical protein
MKARTFTTPPKLGIKLSYLAEELECSTDTLLRNIKRHPSDRLYLKAFKISPQEYRVNWEDLVDFINRNYVGAQIQVA